jgi:hypothetical protein
VAIVDENALVAQRRHADVKEGLAGSVEHDVHAVAAGKFPDRRAQILGLVARLPTRIGTTT